MYSRDTACRVRFTVSGCVSCGGWFGWRTVEDAGPYGDVIPSDVGYDLCVVPFKDSSLRSE